MLFSTEVCSAPWYSRLTQRLAGHLRSSDKSLLRLLALAAVACTGLTGTAYAACGAPVGSTITCTGGQAASVAIPGNASGTPTGPTVHASNNYPAILAVSGAPVGATVSSVTLRLNGYTAAGGTTPVVACTLCGSSRDVGIILKGPGGDALQVMSRIGSASSSNPSNITITIQDGAAAMSAPPSTAFNTTGTFAPTNYDGSGGVDGNRDGEISPVYTPTGPSTFNTAAPLGTATLTSTFAGKAVNGTWDVFLADDSGNINSLGANVSFTSYDLIITYSAASTPTTTTLSRSSSTLYTASPNNTTTLTATVTASSTVSSGTVNFEDGSTTLSGCGAVAVSNGTATCNATFSSAGVHILTALYSGTSTFVSSSGSANILPRPTPRTREQPTAAPRPSRISANRAVPTHRPLLILR